MSEKLQPSPNSNLQWYQFHLWHLFVLTTSFALVCSAFAVQVLPCLTILRRPEPRPGSRYR